MKEPDFSAERLEAVNVGFEQPSNKRLAEHEQGGTTNSKASTQIKDSLDSCTGIGGEKERPQGCMLYVKWEGKMEILNPGPNPRNDHRSFYSSRRFACLGALFSLFLLASISLTAQSGSSAQPPATQSQGQGAPPCSNAPPILKRGSQPDLPPCPEPPQDASAPADSVRLRAPSPDAPLIERARYAALQFSQKLPNFICEEHMARYGQRGQDQRLLDLVSAEVTYNDGQESYRNVKLDQHPTDKGVQELNGSWSVGEFASTLLDLFSPYTDAQFQSGGGSPIAGQDAKVYDFRVRSENSHWRVQAESQTLRPAYKGSVWVDPATARVLRIEMQAVNMPPDFPMDTVESAVDYSYVTIAGNSVLLPVHAESLGCERGSPACSHNIIDFRNYREFKVKSRIVEVK